ncbi:MAG TPA: CHASE3 domain-containing protein, partial [Nitrososphaeraceae archaeon]|nr:CHASE3 domain-containing protein [Nitrososphaeraceae archaeon]
MKDKKLILIAIALPLLTLLILGAKTFEIINTYQEKIKSNEETHQIIITLQNLLTLIIDAETGQRGFIITGNEKYLEPYNISLSNLNTTVTQIGKLVNDKHSDILENVYFNIQSLINSKFIELDKAIDERKNKGYNASAELISTDKGKRIMEQIRNNISLVMQEQEKILKDNTQRSVIDGLNLLYIYVVGIVISTVITIVTIIVTYSQLNIKHKKITKILKSEIDKKTSELQQTNISLTKMNEQLNKNNAMQKEFINIAAHELRTPTQSIIGYLEMLKHFPDNIKKYLEP